MSYRWIVAAILISAGGATGARADAGGMNRAGSFGYGVAFGQPMGLSGKFWLNPSSAVDTALGYHFNDNFDIHTDYLYHLDILGPVRNGSLPLYIGLGGRILAGDDTQFGLRIPIGISYMLPAHRMEFFAEIAPVVVLTDIGSDVDGVVGIRLYAM